MLLVLAAQQFSTLVTCALIALLQDDGFGPAHDQKETHELPCSQQHVPEAPARLLPGLLPQDAYLSAERAPHGVPAEPVFLAGWPQPQQIAPDRGLL